MLWTRNIATQPAGLFQGQRRKSAFTIQGRFTRPVVMNHLVSGPEFSRPFVKLPAKWFVEGVLMKVSHPLALHLLLLLFLLFLAASQSSCMYAQNVAQTCHDCSTWCLVQRCEHLGDTEFSSTRIVG